jgi:RimJ/RimL family protein N-acetyltransferase
MYVQTDNQEFLVAELCRQIGLVCTPHMRCLGRQDNDGQLIGIVGYDNWTGKSCEMHMVGRPGWLSRDFLAIAFRYPFVQLNCNVVIGVVSDDNKHALDIDLRLGFKLIASIPDAHPGGALHILTMRRDQCKWLEKVHGKEITRATATA